MEYNTGRGLLIMPEYGRHIQKMTEHACTIEDREERNRLAQSIVAVMGSLNPHLRDVTDFKHKLWDHLFAISNFKLDVDSPYPKPAPDVLVAKPKALPYPKHSIKYRHYGKVVEELIATVKNMDPGAEKETLIKNTANFMKYLYVTYNKDSVVDEVIFENLSKMSGGEIKVPENLRLTDIQPLPVSNKSASNKPKFANTGRNTNNKMQPRKKIRK